MATAAASAPSTGTLVEPATLKSWLEKGSAIVVDVREPEEFAREHIPGARLVPLSRFDPSLLPQGKALVLHCKSGRRSAEASARVAGQGGPDVHQLKGGIDAWKSAGLPIESNPNVPISIMRQVQIVAGSLTAIGAVLAAGVSPWFLIIPGFIGLGLTFAGLTGTCGLAAVLSAMPWNAPFKRAGSDCKTTGPCN